ncbi:hypothetical protein R1sor_016199 [Riccia sorocarpa]|uniref:Uncharacterized protein n=1 Tax=Riccia sorocarpa TaxID=122646 RepID=A0ABD3HHT9_9MARC
MQRSQEEIRNFAPPPPGTKLDGNFFIFTKVRNINFDKGAFANVTTVNVSNFFGRLYRSARIPARQRQCASYSPSCVMEVERDCRRCNKSLPIKDFSRRQRRSNVTKVHRKCNVCFSSRQTTRLYEPVPDTPNEELVVKTCTYEQLSHMASVAFREAAIDEVVVYQH